MLRSQQTGAELRKTILKGKKLFRSPEIHARGDFRVQKNIRYQVEDTSAAKNTLAEGLCSERIKRKATN